MSPEPIQDIYRLEGLNLWFLPAGRPPENPLELMQSGRLSQLLDQLSAWFDWIVIDSPPILPLADTSVWARLADGILLVTREGTTKRRMLQRGLQALERVEVAGCGGEFLCQHRSQQLLPALRSRGGAAKRCCRRIINPRFDHQSPVSLFQFQFCTPPKQAQSSFRVGHLFLRPKRKQEEERES